MWGMSDWIKLPEKLITYTGNELLTFTLPARSSTITYIAPNLPCEKRLDMVVSPRPQSFPDLTASSFSFVPLRVLHLQCHQILVTPFPEVIQVTKKVRREIMRRNSSPRTPAHWPKKRTAMPMQMKPNTQLDPDSGRLWLPWFWACFWYSPQSYIWWFGRRCWFRGHQGLSRSGKFLDKLEKMLLRKFP